LHFGFLLYQNTVIAGNDFAVYMNYTLKLDSRPTCSAMHTPLLVDCEAPL